MSNFIKLCENLDNIPPLDQRLAYIKNCTRCELSPHLGQNPNCSQVVVGSGNLQAQVLNVLTVPAATEDKFGQPCIGPSNVLMDWWEGFGFERYKDFFWTNSVMCQLPADRDGMDVRKKELDACWHNLSQIIDLMPNLKLIVWYGGPAARAVEGRSVTVSARLHNLGMIPEWIPASHHFQKGRKFLVYGLWHPAFLLRKKGKELEYYEKKYKAGLAFVSQIIKHHLDDIEKFEYPKNYVIAETPEQALAWGEKHLHDNRVKLYAVDFESLGRNGSYNKPIGVAVAYQNPDTGLTEAFWTYFLQKIRLPKSEWHYVRMGKHKGHHLQKYKWVPWHYDSFEQDFMKLTHGLWDIDGYRPAGRDKPMVRAWNNAGFESQLFKGRYGFDFCGNDDQMGLNAFDFPGFDAMAEFRNVSNGNSMKLASILELCHPMLAMQKEPAHELVKKHDGEHGLDVNGYGFLSGKVPEWTCRAEVYEKGQIYNEWLKGLQQDVKKKVKKEEKKSCPLPEVWVELLEDIWSTEYRKLFSEVLAERACFDAIMEFSLAETHRELVNSPDEFAADKFAKKEFDADFFGDHFVDFFEESSELGFSAQY